MLYRIAGFGRNGMRIAFFIIIEKVAIIARSGDRIIFERHNIRVFIGLGVGFDNGYVPAFGVFVAVSFGFYLSADFGLVFLTLVKLLLKRNLSKPVLLRVSLINFSSGTF